MVITATSFYYCYKLKWLHDGFEKRTYNLNVQDGPDTEKFKNNLKFSLRQKKTVVTKVNGYKLNMNTTIAFSQNILAMFQETHYV